ncbi:MAG TPA: hypothetical protein DDW50_07955, partial [Firmicutes bacterium]|nr:hypothetical protein [Bacillota bacterium]
MKNTPKQSLINFFRFSSLKTTIMGLFLPVIVIFVILIGFLSYWIAAGQIRKSTYINISDMVAQDANYLNERLGATFEQLEALQNDIDTLTIIQHLDGREYGTFIPEDYVTMDHSLKKIFLTYNSMFDSLLVDFNDGKFFLYENDRWATKINFSYADWRTHFTNSPSDYYWWNLHRDPIFICPGSQERVISLFKLYGNPMTKVKGIILFNLRADFFREVLNKVQISKNGYLMIFSNDGTMVFKNVAPYARVDSHRILKLIGDNPAGTLWIRS